METTPATVHDSKVTASIQDALAAKDRSPEKHLADEGYKEIGLLVESQHKGIDLVGPVPSSKTWQDRVEGAFNHTQFQIDWQTRQVTCPNGKKSIRSYERHTWRGTPNLTFVFDKADCLPCPIRKHCSRSRTSGRVLTLYPQQPYEAQQKA